MTGFVPTLRSWLAARSDRFWLGLALGLFLCLVLRITLTRHYWPRYDSGLYLSAAVSLHQGLGMRDITAPVSLPEQAWMRVPSWLDDDDPARKPWWPFFVLYPPGVPLLLVPFLALGKGSFAVLQLAPILAGLLSLLLLYRLRREMGGAQWIPVLLLTAASGATLFATRIQSEIFLLPLVLVFLACFRRACADDRLNPRWISGAAMTLLGATIVHHKALFIGAGALLWLLIDRRRPGAIRLRAGFLLLLALTPILLWLANVNQYGANAMESGDNYLLMRNNADRRNVIASPAEFLGVLQHRLWKSLPCFTENLFLVPFETGGHAFIARLLVLLVLLKGVSAWYRAVGGAFAWPVLTTLTGCFLLTPWAEARFNVMVQPLVVWWVLLGVSGRPAPEAGCEPTHTMREADASGERRLPAWAAVVLLAAQLLGWSALTPEKDSYAQEGHPERIPMQWFADRLREDQVVLWQGDNAGFAMLSGRAGLSLMPIEWKNAHPGLVLAEGRNWAAFYFFEPPPPGVEPTFELPRYLTSRRGELQQSRWSTLQHMIEVVTVGPPPWPASGTIPAHDPAAAFRTGIHPRWLRTSAADAASLAVAVFPLPR